MFPNVDANSKRGKLKTAIVAGGNSLLDRWSCAYKWDDVGDVGEARQGGRQCFARLVQPDGTKGSAFDPFNGKEPAVLQFGTDERWYWRVRVRDENLNWSEWSDAGSFELGNPAPEPEVERVLIDKQLPTPGLPTVGLNVKAFASCESVNSGANAAPADLLPRTLQAATGLISFNLANCSAAGLEALVQLTLPSAPSAGSKVLKVSKGANGKWGATEITNASISGNTVSYRVTDGGPLDEDGKVNAAIVDPVMVASPAAVPPPPVNTTPVPVNNPLALMLVAMLMAGAAFWQQRRSR